MAKSLLDLDDDLLAEATAALGTAPQWFDLAARGLIATCDPVLVKTLTIERKGVGTYPIR